MRCRNDTTACRRDLIRSAHPSGYPLVIYLRCAPIPQVSPETSTAQTSNLPPELNDGIIFTAALSVESLPVPPHPTQSASYELLVHRLADFP